MELSPVTVCAAPGNRITFTCSYISNQRLDIEFSSSSSSLVRREIMSDSGARYSWGATRQWTVVVSPDTRQVTCSLLSSQGATVGQLHANIYTGALCSLCLSSVLRASLTSLLFLSLTSF